MSIPFKLFKISFVIIFITSFIVFFIIDIISINITSYNNYLKTTFASKQHHITIRFFKSVDAKETAKKIVDILKTQLTAYNSFVEADVDVLIKKGLREYRGKIKIVGLATDHYPITYNFNNLDIRLLPYFEIRPTGIELFEMFRNSQVEIFNQVLQKSFYQNLPSTFTTYKLKLKTNQTFIQFGAVLDDMKEIPILFMNQKKLNKLLHNPIGYIDGFYINIKNPEKTQLIKKLLQHHFKTAQITTWQEDNPKVNNILIVFSKLGRIIQLIIGILGIMAIVVIFVNEMVKKQPQLRLLHILGMNLKKSFHIALFTIILFSQLLAFLISYFFIAKEIDSLMIIYSIIIPILILLLNNYFLSIKQNILR